MKTLLVLSLLCSLLFCGAAQAENTEAKNAAASAKKTVPSLPPPPSFTTLDFRGGKALCAEISSQRPNIKGFNEKNFLNLPTRRLYAALTFLSDADRALSIYDYCLDYYGAFHCVAIREGNGNFESAPDKVIRTNPKNKYTLLFIIDAAVAGNEIELCTIKALCDNGPFSKQLIPFRNLKDKPFTPPARVPLTGLIPEKK